MMTPPRYQQIKEIFQSVIELPHSEQAAHLDRHCSDDPDLRREVESLIATHGQPGDSIETLAAEVAVKMLAGDQSASLTGRQIGPYQVIDQIGQGGMGEVYLAQDGRLGRRIALKLLPPQFAGDERRVLRFEQEARAVSALNHPNIITIFDAGHVEDIYFIATEYVDGRTLRAELDERGRLPVKEAIKIALQIADALTSAHRAGIVHRDIKPENVMLRRDGYIKVLDFGLAKLAEGMPPDHFVAGTPLPSNSYLSQAGTVFGTIKYMAPEQARGQAVDARTDVFSLGIVLYEMLTGRLPFAAATGDHIQTPPNARLFSIKQLAPELPAELQQVIQQALAEERRLRQQTIDEFANQLRLIAEDLQFRDRLGVPDEPPTAVAKASRRSAKISVRMSRRRFIVICLVTMAPLLGSLFIWRLTKTRRSPAAPASEFSPVRLTHDLASDTAPSWSPDGKQIAFTSNREGQPAIFVMNEDGSGARRIHNSLQLSDGAIWLPDGRIRFGDGRYSYTMKPDGSDLVRLNASGALSPDGRRILSQKELIPGDGNSSELFVANADGRNPRRLTRNAIYEADPGWGPDGKKIAFTCFPDGGWPKGSICIINDDGSGLTRLTNEPLKAASPLWSPDGTRIAFAVTDDQKAIYIMNADGRNQLKLTDVATDLVGFAWSPDGKKVAYATDYEGNFEIYVIDTDPSHQTNLTHHLAEDTSPQWSPDGKKIAFISNRDGKSALYMMNPDGGGQRRILDDIIDQEISWSPDGRRFIFVRKDTDNNYDLYLANADGGNIVRLTSDAAKKYCPRWSPDGGVAVFSQDRDGRYQLYAIDLESRAIARLSDSQEHEWQNSFSPDGKRIVFSRSRARGVLRDIWAMDSNGGDSRIVAAAPGADEFTNPCFSPDGRRIAFQRFDIGVRVWDIWIMSADGGAQTRLTFAGGRSPTWSPDGKRIAFTSKRRTGNAEIYVMDVSPTAGLQ
ncbi:MAG TPA: protein kinase [Blastocatellia bacterium]|nr:protein kinase [Blastocatellia bacterium]